MKAIREAQKHLDAYRLHLLEAEYSRAENELHKAIIEADVKRFIHSTPGRDRLS